MIAGDGSNAAQYQMIDDGMDMRQRQPTKKTTTKKRR